MNKFIHYAKYGLLFAFVFAVTISVAPTPALAGTCVCTNGDVTESTCNIDSQCGTACTVDFRPATCTGPNSGSTTQPTTVTGSGGTATASPLKNPLAVCPEGTTGQKCVQLVAGNLIKSALGIVGSIALLMIIWGGFLWLTSMGNSDKIEKGKNTLTWAVLGLVLIFTAYAITNFLITTIATSGK